MKILNHSSKSFENQFETLKCGESSLKKTHSTSHVKQMAMTFESPNNNGKLVSPQRSSSIIGIAHSNVYVDAIHRQTSTPTPRIKNVFHRKNKCHDDITKSDDDDDDNDNNENNLIHTSINKKLLIDSPHNSKANQPRKSSTRNNTSSIKSSKPLSMSANFRRNNSGNKNGSRVEPKRQSKTTTRSPTTRNINSPPPSSPVRRTSSSSSTNTRMCIATPSPTIKRARRAPKPAGRVIIAHGGGGTLARACIERMRIDNGRVLSTRLVGGARVDSYEKLFASVPNDVGPDDVVLVLVPSGSRAMDTYLLHEAALDTLACRTHASDNIVLGLIYNDVESLHRSFTKYDSAADARAKRVSPNYVQQQLDEHCAANRQQHAPRYRIAPLLRSQRPNTDLISIELSNKAHAVATVLRRIAITES